MSKSLLEKLALREEGRRDTISSRKQTSWAGRAELGKRVLLLGSPAQPLGLLEFQVREAPHFSAFLGCK